MEKRPNSKMNREFSTLDISTPEEHVMQCTLNRPDVANAMNTQMGLDLMHCFEDLALDPKDVRCVVLTGAGDKAFCAGGDLKERKGMTDEQWQRQHVIFERMMRALMACPTPIIAAVNGAAYAGGCEIALCADFIYAAEHARFALTEVTLGIMPGAGATQNLARAVGERRAKEIILTGKPFTVAQAAEWGSGQPGAAGRRFDERGARDRRGIAAQRADLGAAGQAVDQPRHEHVGLGRPRLRDRGL